MNDPDEAKNNTDTYGPITPTLSHVAASQSPDPFKVATLSYLDTAY
jgi:hypothetical protein